MKILVEFNVEGVDGVEREKVAEVLARVLAGSTAGEALNDGVWSAFVERTQYARAHYENGECPDCGESIPKTAKREEDCSNCGHVWNWDGPGIVSTTVRDDLLVDDLLHSHHVHHLGEYCFSCGEHYTEADVEGGRCESCGSAVEGATTETIAEQFEQLDDEIKQKILDHMKY
jgi:hypothetical protein